MANPLYRKHIISINDLSREELELALHTAAKLKAQLLGSGAILPEVIKAAELLETFGVAADVWSVTSYGELYRDGNACDRWNMLHPAQKPRVPYIAECLGPTEGV